jgi:hypothetical protein
MAIKDTDAVAARAALNRHGYGFQHAIIREVRRLYRPGVGWQADGTEFPVEVNGASTHVDLLLRSRSGLLVCECKRVDPALGIWCFARSALATSHDADGQAVVHEAIAHGDPAHGAYVVRHQSRVSTDLQYHVGSRRRHRRDGAVPGGTG